MIAWAAGDGATVALRFLLYVDLLLLAGLTLCGGRTAPVSARRRTLIALAAFGLLLTIMQFAASCLAMVGGDAASLDREMVRFIAFETGMGLASLSRIGLLALTLLAVSTGSVTLVSPALAVGALATFAWSGHAGAAEGMSGLAHRIADIIHLLAAAIWIGTLSLLITSVRAPMVPRTALVATLRRFALVGTVVVGLLVVTGLINLWAIAGLDVGGLLALEYGRVLLVKLALFGAMLAVAALNRWRYTPALLGGATATPLRRSLSLELSAGMAVLAAVALLGTVSPN